MNIQTSFIFAYLLVQFLIGVWSGRFIKNESDFLLGGRQLGLFLSTFTIFATWFGAETCIGAAGMIYKTGPSGGRIEPFGYTLCLIAVALFIAKQMRVHRYTTLADFFFDRYGTLVEKISVFILIPSTLIWTAAQIKAFGHILSSSTQLEPLFCIRLSMILVIGYTMVGGLLASALTDTLQGVVLILGLIILGFMSTQQLGGPNVLIHKVSAIKWSFNPQGENILHTIDAWMIPILGSLTGQELISRLLATKSPQVAQKSTFMAAFMYLCIGLIPVSLGLIGHDLVGQITHSDQFLPTLAAKILPQGLYIIFTGAMVSAILSTADSNLLSVSGLLSHNIINSFFKKQSDAQKVFVGRAALVFLGLITYFMAIQEKNISLLVKLASSFGTSGILIITIFGLYTKLGGPLTALATLIAGLAGYPLFENVLELPAPFLASVVLCLVIFLFGHFLENFKKNRGLQKQATMT